MTPHAAPADADGGRRPAHGLESVLDAAVRVFNERGYDGTSMEHLAAALGIRKSSIYHHVPSKEALLGLALDRALDALFAATDEEAARTGRAIDRLEHVVRRAVEVMVDQLPYVTLLLRVRGNTATEQTALERRRAFDRFVAGLVESAAREGDLAPGLDPAVTARLLFGTVNSMTEWLRPGGDAEARDLADAVVGLTFGGLRRDRAPR